MYVTNNAASATIRPQNSSLVQNPKTPTPKTQSPNNNAKLQRQICLGQNVLVSSIFFKLV